MDSLEIKVSTILCSSTEFYVEIKGKQLPYLVEVTPDDITLIPQGSHKKIILPFSSILSATSSDAKIIFLYTCNSKKKNIRSMKRYILHLKDDTEVVQDWTHIINFLAMTHDAIVLPACDEILKHEIPKRQFLVLINPVGGAGKKRICSLFFF